MIRQHWWLTVTFKLKKKKKKLQEKNKARSWREIEWCLIVGRCVCGRPPMAHFLYVPVCPAVPPGLAQQRVLGPTHALGTRGHGAKHGWCCQGKLLTCKLEHPGRELQSKQRPHFSKKKQSDRSTAKLQGQQKSLSRGDAVQFVNPGGH